MASIYDSMWLGGSYLSSPAMFGDVAFNSALANVCSSSIGDNYGVDRFMMGTSYGGMFAPSGASSSGLFGNSSRYTSALQDTPIGTFNAWNAMGAIPFNGAMFCVTGQGMGTGAAGGGAGAVPSPGIDATTGAEDETSATEISDEARNQAVTQLQGMGYGEDEARAVVDNIVSVADNEGDFGEILSKVPVKSTENAEGEDAPNEDWTEKFGVWYSKYILGMDTAAAKDYVHSVAFDAEAPFEQPTKAEGPYIKLSSKSIRTDKIDVDGANGPAEPVDAQVFTVDKEDGTGLDTGTEVFKVGKKNSKYYIKDGNEFVEVPHKASGGKLYIHKAADPNDFAAVHASGDKPVTDNAGKIYNVYVMDKPEIDGKAQGVYDQAGDEHKIYHDSDGKWYSKNGDAYDLLKDQPEFEDGKLLFGGKADWKVGDGFDVENMDASDYMAILNEGAGEARAASGAQESDEDASRKARVETVVDKFKNTFETPNDNKLAAKMDFEVSEDGKKLDITCDEADAKDLYDLLGRNGNLEHLNKLFGELGTGTKTYLNGELITSGQNSRATAIKTKLDKMGGSLSPADAALAKKTFVTEIGSDKEAAKMVITPIVFISKPTKSVLSMAKMVGAKKGDISPDATSLDLTVVLPAELHKTGNDAVLRNEENEKLLVNQIKKDNPQLKEVNINWTDAKDGETAKIIAEASAPTAAGQPIAGTGKPGAKAGQKKGCGLSLDKHSVQMGTGGKHEYKWDGKKFVSLSGGESYFPKTNVDYTIDGKEKHWDGKKWLDGPASKEGVEGENKEPAGKVEKKVGETEKEEASKADSKSEEVEEEDEATEKPDEKSGEEEEKGGHLKGILGNTGVLGWQPPPLNLGGKKTP